jgi:hypothetical protein
MITIVTGYTKDDILNFVDNCLNEHIRSLDFPEEGYHPKYACNIVDDAVKNDNDLIILTLAECVVNRIGYLIYKKVITEADIIWLNELGKPNKTKYNDKGFIENWQIGFFSPNEIRDEL